MSSAWNDSCSRLGKCMKQVVDVVAALIWQDHKFLICQRPATKTRPLLWEFVGGKVEPGETKEQALVRECQEELGVVISIDNEFIQTEYEYPDICVRLTVFNARISCGTPVMKEHNDLKWIDISESKQFSFCPADIPVINKLVQIDKMIGGRGHEHTFVNRARR